MDDLLLFTNNPPIDHFTDRFGATHGHLEMAYHAALPLALTPDLLYLIWANFRLDTQGKPLNIQWVTVADLILSPLCREIRHEMYVMETAVRQELLDQMANDARFGPDYILRLGQFVQHYASQFIQSDIPSLRQYAQAQQWAAQAYTEPDRLLDSLSRQFSQAPSDAETIRLADLLNTFSEPLTLDWVPTSAETAVNYDRLHTFGDGLAKFVRGDTQTATRQLRRLLGPAREFNIGSMSLPLPTAVAQALAKQEEKIYTYRVTVKDETAVHIEQIDNNGTSLKTLTGRLTPPGITQFHIERATTKEEVREFGQFLFDILFSDETLQADFLTFYGEAFKESAFLRFELDIDNGITQDLALLPWELLCLPDNTGFGTDWLAAAPEVFFTRWRKPFRTNSEPRLLPADKPLRIALVVGDDTYPESPLNYELIWESYQSLVRRFPDQFELLPLLADFTANIIDDLLENRPHIVHFLVHPRQFSPKGREEGQILLNHKPEEFSSEWLNGDQFARALASYKPTIVMLQSNVFTRPEVLHGLQDVAAVVAESEITTVLSWQFSVSDTAVSKFIHTVFPALAQGIPLDEAVQNGRRALLREENPVAFAAPSLFSSSIVRRRPASEPAPPTPTLADEPSVLEFEDLLEQHTKEVNEDLHLATLTAVSNWLNNANAERTFILTGEQGVGKTTIAALLAQYFRGNRQPSNNLYALAEPTFASSVYFCQPSRPETLHPRSFALTIASQWASRDKNFAYLQSIIDTHADFELDELIDRLLIKPFVEIGELIDPDSIIFLVDDLEAALQHSGEITIVDVLLRMMRQLPRVRFLLTAQMQAATRSKLADIDAQFLPLGDRYDNFDTHIGQPLPDPDMRYPYSIASVSGEEEAVPTHTFAPITVLGEERLAKMGDLVSNSEDAAEIGQRLFQIIFPEQTYGIAQRSLENAISRGKEGLRLRVQFDDPALQAYPWELCHNGRSFIFNNPEQPILLTRTIGTANFKAAPPLPRPTRLLVVIAAPIDQGRADIDMQGKTILRATEKVVIGNALEVQIMRHATLGKLDNMAASYQPNIVHFISFSSSEKDGVLILENEKGRSNIVPVGEIMRILQMAPVQCVILSPIGGGETAPTQLAPQFIQEGIPTVLAEQFVLPDQPAVEFMRTFYRALLVDRLSFEESVWNGRQHLATTHREPFWSHMTLVKSLKSEENSFPLCAVDYARIGSAYISESSSYTSDLEKLEEFANLVNISYDVGSSKML
ncbi:hypothetical protein MNBD_CHLOROFLEXI01-350 [hydrothermal vent metagenome]|uniref:AAA+ ATPase domain-containing protein n=1 Tax=hydrothermal vent metagenome TaxID=652676 RepID=A0A3B0W1W4_9ZZZZ